MIKIGINGFGRIGRMVFRAAVDKSPLVSIVHSADFLVSNLVEKTTEH